MDEPQNSDKNNLPDENERLVIEIDDLDPEPEKPALVIESEDLIDIEPMQTFHLPPSPRRYDTSEPMPTPGTRTRGISASNTITGLLVGLAAGIVSWLIMEPFIEDGAYTTLLEAFIYCSLIPGVVGLLLGFALAAYEDILNSKASRGLKAGLKGAGRGLLGGLIGGVFAQAIYSLLLSSADPLTFGMQVLARTLAWALAGTLIGWGQASVHNSRERAKNGLLGGLIGGTIGGFMFDLVGALFGSSGAASRGIGFSAICAAIGFASALVAEIRKEAWLKIESGAMLGKQFILYNAYTSIGSSAEADITLIKDPSVEPVHAVIESQGRSHTVTPVARISETRVNRQTVHHRTQLRSGDEIMIGQTLIRYLERAATAGMLVLAALAIIFTASVQASTQDAGRTDEQLRFVAKPVQAVIADGKPSVVTVIGANESGTGVIVNPWGYVVTCDHVAKSERLKIKLSNGDELEAEKVASNAVLDIAVLKVNAINLPCAVLGTAATARDGDSVVAIGSPRGLSDSASIGIISSSQRNIDGKRFIQTDAAIDSGSSGRPLVNTYGHVIDIMSAKVKGTNQIGFAIPVDDVAAFLEKAGVPFVSAGFEHLVWIEHEPPAGPMPAAKASGINLTATIVVAFILVVALVFLWLLVLRPRLRRSRRRSLRRTPMTVPDDDDIEIILK